MWATRERGPPAGGGTAAPTGERAEGFPAMKRLLLALGVLTLALSGTAALAAGPLPTPPSGELLRLDRQARTAFARAHSGLLPASGRPREGAEARAFDWTEQGGGTEGHRQGRDGSCWAHAGVEALEASWEIRNGKHRRMAVQPVLDYTGIPGAAHVAYAMDALLRYGTAKEAAYPFTGTPGPLDEVPTPYRAVAWGYVVPDG